MRNHGGMDEGLMVNGLILLGGLDPPVDDEHLAIAGRFDDLGGLNLRPAEVMDGRHCEGMAFEGIHLLGEPVPQWLLAHWETSVLSSASGVSAPALGPWNGPRGRPGARHCSILLRRERLGPGR